MKALAIGLVVALAGAAVWYLASDEPPGATHAEADGPASATTVKAPGAVFEPRRGEIKPTDRAKHEEPPVRATSTEDASPEQVGRVQLTQGIDARKDGHPEQARALFEAAAAAFAKAIDAAGDHPDPWTLANMAQAQLELGNDVEALGWADRALQQLRLGSNDDYTAFRAAQLTMNVGIVYFRAGQKQTGIAYMDQAISMAPTDFDRQDFLDLKEETIGS